MPMNEKTTFWFCQFNIYVSENKNRTMDGNGTKENSSTIVATKFSALFENQ